MTYNFDGYNYLIRLERGERLSTALEQFAAESGIDNGAWLSGVGASSEVTLGFYNLNSKAYKWRTFSTTMEIAALNGNLVRDEDGKFMFHLHGTFADDEYKTVGGHVKDLVAGATVELFSHRAYQPMQRKFDEVTGLKLLDLEQGR